MSYTVLARRYRSQTFDDVVGQDPIARTLKNAILTDRVAHAYLFCGTRGVGKTTIARILAKSLNCLSTEAPTVTPCLKCDSCRLVNLGEDLDVIEIDGASNRGIDNIRELRQNAIYRPARSRFKIYIIDEVHMLTAEAFNALLKTLEEPPSHVKFIFATTEPNKVLATIQSRCQRFDFAAIDAPVITCQLEKILNDEKIAFDADLPGEVARFAAGSMRDALSLLDQLISSSSDKKLSVQALESMLGRPGRETLLALLSAMGDSDAPKLLDCLDTLLRAGQSPSVLCESLVEAFRDMMIILAAGADSRVITAGPRMRTSLAELARKFDLPGLVYSITALERLRWTLRNSDTARALLEASLLRLALSEHFIGLDSIDALVRGRQEPAQLKKKQIAETPHPHRQIEHKTAPTESDKPDQAAGTLFQGPVELVHLRNHWEQLLQRIRGLNDHLAPFFAMAEPCELKNDTLTLKFPADGRGQLAMEMCKRKMAVLEPLIEQAVGKIIRLKLELGASAPAAQEVKPHSPGARATSKQTEQALSDPSVQLLLKGLSATPLEIAPLSQDHEQTSQEQEDQV